MTVGWVGSGLTGNSKREMNPRTTVLHASVTFFLFGQLLSFFQLSRLGTGRLWKAFARRQIRISFWIVGG